MLGRCVTRRGLISKSCERAGTLTQHSFRLNNTPPVFATLTVLLLFSLFLSPQPSHRLPLVGACSRIPGAAARAGSPHLPSFSVRTSLEVVGRLLGPCLGLVAVSLGAGPFPNHGNVLMHLHRTFPVLTALAFSRRPISVSPSLCLSVSPLPSPRLPLVGACSRRCGSRRFPASAVVVFAVSLLLPLFVACP